METKISLTERLNIELAQFLGRSVYESITKLTFERFGVDDQNQIWYKAIYSRAVTTVVEPVNEFGGLFAGEAVVETVALEDWVYIQVPAAAAIY